MFWNAVLESALYVFGLFMTFALTLAWLMRRPTNVDTSIDRDMVGLFLRRSGLMKGKTDAGGSSGTVTVYDCLILGILTWGTDSKDLAFCLDVTLYSRLMQLVLYRAVSSDRCIPQVMTRTVAVDVLERKKAQRSRKTAGRAQINKATNKQYTKLHLKRSCGISRSRTLDGSCDQYRNDGKVSEPLGFTPARTRPLGTRETRVTEMPHVRADVSRQRTRPSHSSVTAAQQHVCFMTMCCLLWQHFNLCL